MTDIYQKLVLSAAGDNPHLSLYAATTAPAQPAVVVAEGQVSHLSAAQRLCYIVLHSIKCRICGHPHVAALAAPAVISASMSACCKWCLICSLYTDVVCQVLCAAVAHLVLS